MKDNVKTEHWVVHLQLRSLDTDDLFKMTPVVDDIHAIVTGNTMEQFVYVRKRIQIYEKKKEKKMWPRRLIMMLL